MNTDSQTKTQTQCNLLTGKDLILSSRKYATEDPKMSWFYTLSTFALLILTFLGTFLTIPIVFRLGFTLFFGLFMVRFFVIYHDYQHGAILRDSLFAKFIMTIFGIFILAPTSIWKRTHDHHHHHNSKLSDGGIGSFPLISKKKYQRLSKKQRAVYLIRRHPITIFSGYVTLFIFDFNIYSLMRSPRNHMDSFFALLLHFLAGLTIYYYGGFVSLALSWLIPFILAHGFGAYLFYAQHNFPGAIFEENHNWEYAHAATNSTSFLVMSPVMNWFTGNIGYHHVHHINHRIPFYRLQEVMQEMPELQTPTTTTLHPIDMMHCLRLKLWDSEKCEMVGL